MNFSLARKTNKYLAIGELEIIEMALEKQVPEKPYEESYGYSPEGRELWQDFCPRCNFDFEEYEFKYCPNCGQAIDWRSK